MIVRGKINSQTYHKSLQSLVIKLHQYSFLLLNIIFFEKYPFILVVFKNKIKYRKLNYSSFLYSVAIYGFTSYWLIV